jgi:uncharacterized membrane protein
VTTENWALFFHLVGAFLFVAGATVAAVAFEAARRRRSTAEIAVLLALARTGALLVIVGGAVVLGFGLWLVDVEDAGYDAGWVQGAIALFVVVVLLGAFGGHAPKRARQLAQAGQETVELRQALDDRVALAFNYASAVLVVAIVVLMVFKPGA